MDPPIKPPREGDPVQFGLRILRLACEEKGETVVCPACKGTGEYPIGMDDSGPMMDCYLCRHYGRVPRSVADRYADES